MNTPAPLVTLTFDNGPEPEATPGVLDVLRRRGLHATFFVIGQKLEDPARRAIAAQAHAEGHWIGNHTYTHAGPLGDRPPGHAEAEIGRTQALIGDLAHPDRLFRPVGGGGHLGPHLLSVEARDYLLRDRYTCALWNAVPGDWKDAEHWPDRALAMCLAQDHAVLVLHDLPNGAMRHLDRFLGRLADAGASFRQDFPDACLAIRRGVPSGRLGDWVAPASLTRLGADAQA
ncbi:peptidoglycan/xylan/chitin deacetylase (PgdA/CDA1 family) [Humitalea rosea]|uniref:Chitooligosaccharide deacetylase n=1 Tax=Humitalea rosea TaxID=990373 RepID=A0A2W7HZJ2_9PROT|nr:peptidoglycan/xylan/chitin deacetylase (PgdA/CDA1 family) [Humitalea rosea]